MKIKLLITDLDGTLLDSKKAIHPEFWKAHELLTRMGVTFAAASGRQLASIEALFRKISDSTIFIAENGALVSYKGEDIHVNGLDMSLVTPFIHTGREIPRAEIVLCGKKSAYVENRDSHFISETRKYYNKLIVVDDLTTVNDNILKVAIYDPAGSETNSYPRFRRYEGQFKVSVSGAEWLDVMHLDTNKGAAIEKVQALLGISKSETMAFGDFLNDLEMMHAAGYSYAMKNAHPEIKRVSRFVTEHDNNNNGVVKTIMKWLDLEASA